MSSHAGRSFESTFETAIKTVPRSLLHPNQTGVVAVTVVVVAFWTVRFTCVVCTVVIDALVVIVEVPVTVQRLKEVVVVVVEITPESVWLIVVVTVLVIAEESGPDPAPVELEEEKRVPPERVVLDCAEVAVVFAELK